MISKPSFVINKYSIWGYIKYFIAQIIFIIIPFIGYFFIDTDNYLFLYIAIFLLLFLASFFNKKRNKVYSIEFNNEEDIVTLKFFQYLISKKINISYETYSSDFAIVNFGYSLMNTLIIKDNSNTVAMIGVKNWFNWKEADLKSIHNYLSSTTNNVP